MDSHTRICGIRAIEAAGNKHQKRRLAEAVLLHIANWEKQELGAAMRALFPDTLTIDELLTILESVKPPPTYSVNLLDLELEEVVNSNCSPQQRESLLIGLVGLLEREPHIERLYCEVSQRYAWLLGYAAKLAERIILDADAKTPQFSDALLRAIELEAQGQDFQDGYHRPDHKLDDLVREQPALRHALFWRAVERQRQKFSAEGKRLTDWSQVRPEAPALQFSADDVEIFLTAVRGRTAIDDRLVALTAAFALWRNRSQGEQNYARMWSAVQSDPDLEARLHALLHPEPLSETERRPRDSIQDFRRRQAERQVQQEEARREQVAKLRGNVDRIRSVDQKTVQHVFGDLYYLGQEIARLTNSLTRWGSHRWDLLEAEYGHEVAKAARDGLIAYWRLFEPPLRSERDTDGVPRGTITGLVGLAIEARERPGWAYELSAQDAQRACRYALCELNGFPVSEARLKGQL